MELVYMIKYKGGMELDHFQLCDCQFQFEGTE